MWIKSMNSFEVQCITEGLQIDKAGLSTRIRSQMDKTNEKGHHSCLQISLKHFMCTLLDEMELVRNMGQRS